MSSTIRLPSLSPGMTEGRLVRWLKNEGDLVEKGEVIAEIETDKSVLELEAIEPGRLVRILVPEDSDAVPVDEPIAMLMHESDDAAPEIAPAPVSDVAPEARYTSVPNSSIQKIVAERLAEAKRSIPHIYLTIDCCIDELLKVRAELNGQAHTDTRTSINDFIVRASALALRDVPRVNAAWDEEAIRVNKDIDVAVAVATSDGLLTPIVRNADEKCVTAIAAEMKDLSERAQNRRLLPAEFTGGGFCVSNLGMYGIRQFDAIINPPHAAILAIGAAEPRPVVSNHEITVASMMTCTLSCDHRVLDGVAGARFLESFDRHLRDPRSLIA